MEVRRARCTGVLYRAPMLEVGVGAGERGLVAVPSENLLPPDLSPTSSVPYLGVDLV